MSQPLQKNESMLQREAFEYWFALPPEKRTVFALVAHEFGVTETRVRGWSRKYHWLDMARSRDNEAAMRLSEIAVETVVSTKLKYHERLRKTIEKWFEAHFPAQKPPEGEMDIEQATLMAIKPSEVASLIKLDVDITSGKDVQEAIEGKKSKDETDPDVKKLSTDELRRLAQLSDQIIDKAKRGDPSGVGAA